MSTPDHAYSTAAELIAAMDAGTVSAVELTEAAIERIERHDGDINAVPVRDFERALLAARDADAARARGERGPLLGVPMTVKESFNVAGLPTTWGIPAFKDFVPAEDAVAVARLKAAGAVILGKTNVPVALGDLQTYNPLHGTTNNPWNIERTPGGSSGGSAAALAAGFGAVSIGSDIAGSLRIPAHFTGVYAHKPSFGLLPSRGHTPPPAPPLAYDRDLTVIGPMARGAGDLAAMFGLLADPDETGPGIAHRLALRPARHDDLAGYRILVVDTHPLIPTSAEVRTTIDRLASDLTAAGVSVERHSALLPDLVEAARLYMCLLLATIAAGYPPDLYTQAVAAARHIDPDDVSLAAARARGAVLSHRDWVTTDTLRTRHRARWSELFTEFDIVLCPAAPTTAFVHDQSPDQWTRTIPIDGVPHDYADQLVWPGIAGTPGLPATVAPIARSDDGLPIGVQLIGPLFEDRTPLRFAELLEREFGGFQPAPAAHPAASPSDLCGHGK
ncbi:amidase [Nonomuraea maritima]|uniref:amidase n=1 Tax=Nonomuraea maritima TaxID=683260 RepID=UPI0037200366